MSILQIAAIVVSLVLAIGFWRSKVLFKRTGKDHGGLSLGVVYGAISAEVVVMVFEARYQFAPFSTYSIALFLIGLVCFVALAFFAGYLLANLHLPIARGLPGNMDRGDH